MDLSIVTPAAPNRFDRIEMIFKRLELNASRYNKIKFEFIIVDDSIDGQYKELIDRKWSYLVKYVHLPIAEPYPNPAYMRNVGLELL